MLEPRVFAELCEQTNKLKGAQAKAPPIEIFDWKMAIFSILVNFCASDVKANISGAKWIPKLSPRHQKAWESSLFGENYGVINVKLWAHFN